MPARVCLSCGQLSTRTSPRGLCRECQADYERARPARATYDSPAWRRLRAAALSRWVRANGWTCPGWGIPRHSSYDLTADHPEPLAIGGAALPPVTELAILCRSCNARKGATKHPATTTRST